MILTGEIRSTRKEIYPTAVMPTVNLTQTGPGLNLSINGGKPTNNRLDHAMAFEGWRTSNLYNIGTQFLRYREHAVSSL